MPSPSHETLVTALREQPALLSELVRALLKAPLDQGLKPVDSTLRFTDPEEVRPDLVLIGRRPRWVIAEVQNGIDCTKRRRWLLAAAVLFNEHGEMGDVLIITASPGVARWAASAAVVRSELGTRLELRPVVLLLAEPALPALLDPSHPELALFATWAMHRRRGRSARATVLRAIELTDELPPPLQEAQRRAIFNLLSKRMLAFAKEAMMDPNKRYESPWFREWKLELAGEGRAASEAKGKAEGKQEALLTFFSARGLRVPAAQRKRIEKCMRIATLDRWIEKAATADSVDEALGPVPAAPRKKAAAKQARPASRRRTSPA